MLLVYDTTVLDTTTLQFDVVHRLARRCSSRNHDRIPQFASEERDAAICFRNDDEMAEPKEFASESRSTAIDRPKTPRASGIYTSSHLPHRLPPYLFQLPDILLPNLLDYKNDSHTMTFSPEDPAIDVQKLCFSYQGNNSEGIAGEQTLEDIDLNLPQGARCLLIGANGCELRFFSPTFLQYRPAAHRPM